MRSKDYQRTSYTGSGLSRIAGASPQVAPLTLLQLWWEEAVADPRIYEPSAASLATYDSQVGLPDCRILLVKDFDDSGVCFFTNLQSAKGQQISRDPQGAIAFLWHPMFRQVRLRGPVTRCTPGEDDEYWRTRPRASQIASWSSQQSQPTAGRDDINGAFDEAVSRFDGREVPLPDNWGGFRLRPLEVEFWVGMESRLHDRLVWRSTTGRPESLSSNKGWQCQRLQP